MFASYSILLWIGLGVFLVTMLTLDLKVFHRRSREVSVREALAWSGGWISLAFLFAAGLFVWMDSHRALLFITGYLIEWTLSMDNLFVFLMIFSYFRVPSKYQRKVLFWGIFGALVMRGLFIFAGVSLIHRFHWMVYVFGAFLVYAGVKMACNKDVTIEPEQNPVLKVFRRLFRVSDRYHEDRFMIRNSGRLVATPLLVVLLVIETTDVVFALDSVPAILAVSTDPFIVYSSNAFAILGLRALYFALEATMRLFCYLHYGLSVVLAFVGVKLLVSSFYHIPVSVVLPLVGVILALSIGASLLWAPKAASHDALQCARVQKEDGPSS